MKDTKDTPMRSLLLAGIDQAFDRASWHGPNLWNSVRKVTPEQASLRISARKTIWEQLLHAAYWKQRVVNKLAGTTRFSRKGSNWPTAPAEPNERVWREDLDLLRQIHSRLRDAVGTLPPSKLDAKTLWLIQGAAAHDLYHAGQIRLLRRLIEDEA